MNLKIWCLSFKYKSLNSKNQNLNTIIVKGKNGGRVCLVNHPEYILYTPKKLNKRTKGWFM